MERQTQTGSVYSFLYTLSLTSRHTHMHVERVFLGKCPYMELPSKEPGGALIILQVLVH